MDNHDYERRQNEHHDYERRQSVADAAYGAQGGIAVLTARFDTHERVCGDRYRALQNWLVATFCVVLASTISGFGGILFYIITQRH